MWPFRAHPEISLKKHGRLHENESSSPAVWFPLLETTAQSRLNWLPTNWEWKSASAASSIAADIRTKGSTSRFLSSCRVEISRWPKNTAQIWLRTCGCCYGTTKEAESILKHDLSLCDYVNNALKGEGLAYKGKSTVRHLLEVLSVSPGIPNLKARLDGTCPGLRVAAHYGCHLLRPSNVVGFDNPLFPSTLELLIEATGAVSFHGHRKLECCGAPLIGTNDTTSLELAKKKLGSANRPKPTSFVRPAPAAPPVRKDQGELRLRV